jgi:hypothetical protein
MKVLVADTIQSGLAIFHDEGLLVFNVLSKSLKIREKTEVSFEKIERCSTQFLNASIGNLYLNFDPAEVDSLIHFNYGKVNLLNEKIKEVRDNAIHSKEYDQSVENAAS